MRTKPPVWDSRTGKCIITTTVGSPTSPSLAPHKVFPFADISIPFRPFSSARRRTWLRTPRITPLPTPTLYVLPKGGPMTVHPQLSHGRWLDDRQNNTKTAPRLFPKFTTLHCIHWVSLNEKWRWNSPRRKLAVVVVPCLVWFCAHDSESERLQATHTNTDSVWCSCNKWDATGASEVVDGDANAENYTEQTQNVINNNKIIIRIIWEFVLVAYYGYRVTTSFTYQFLLWTSIHFPGILRLTPKEINLYVKENQNKIQIIIMVTAIERSNCPIWWWMMMMVNSLPIISLAVGWWKKTIVRSSQQQSVWRTSKGYHRMHVVHIKREWQTSPHPASSAVGRPTTVTYM